MLALKVGGPVCLVSAWGARRCGRSAEDACSSAASDPASCFLGVCVSLPFIVDYSMNLIWALPLRNDIHDFMSFHDLFLNVHEWFIKNHNRFINMVHELSS
jgi:hypothetical protein